MACGAALPSPQMCEKQIDCRRGHLIEVKIYCGEGRHRPFGAHAIVAGGKPQVLGNPSSYDPRRFQNACREGIHRHAKG